MQEENMVPLTNASFEEVLAAVLEGLERGGYSTYEACHLIIKLLSFTGSPQELISLLLDPNGMN